MVYTPINDQWLKRRFAMLTHLNRLLISITVIGLSACAKTPVGPYVDLKRPPKDADV